MPRWFSWRAGLVLALTAGLALAGLYQLRSAPVQASSGGRTGASGNPADGGQTCSRCHSGGLTPTVTLAGPDVVMPGSTNAYTLTIAEGQRALGGLDVSTTGGMLGVPAGATDIQLLGGEITHTAPKSSDSMGEVVFSFLWTAPDADGEVTFYGAGNSVDGDTTTSGDAADTDQLTITVGEAPEPTEPVEPTPLPTIEIPHEVVVADLNNPHGVTPLDNGRLLVGEAGTAGDSWQPGQFAPGAGDGRILSIDAGEPSDREVLVDEMTNAMDPGGGIVGGNHAIQVELPGATTQTATVTLAAQAGGPGHLRPDEAAKILMIDAEGAVEIFADPLAYETENNPGGEEGEGGIDSNPWRLVPGPDGRVYVVDAGANDILALDLESRELSTWAVFPELFEDQQAIPTGLAFDPDDEGVAYVSLLGPFGPGNTEIHRLEDRNDDGDMLDEDEHQVLVGGLKLVTDIGFGPGGMLFFTQISDGTLSAIDPACWSAEAACTAEDVMLMVDQLPAASALAFDAEGNAYVTTTNRPNPMGTTTTTTAIVRIPASDLVPEPTPTPTMDPEPTEPTPTPTEEPTVDQPMIYLPHLRNQE